jgi:hypothetical protein
MGHRRKETMMRSMRKMEKKVEKVVLKVVMKVNLMKLELGRRLLNQALLLQPLKQKRLK